MDAISLLKTGFIICLSAAIIFFVITVVLFFLFDIKTIFMIRSGRAQAKSVKEMQEANANTGHLRNVKGAGSKMAKKGTEKKRTQEIAPPVAPPAPPESVPYHEITPPDEQVTEELFIDETVSQTEVLQREAPADIVPETGYSETTVLSEVTDQTFDSKPSHKQSGIYFEVIKKIVIRDTEEVIR